MNNVNKLSGISFDVRNRETTNICNGCGAETSLTIDIDAREYGSVIEIVPFSTSCKCNFITLTIPLYDTDNKRGDYVPGSISFV